MLNRILALSFLSTTALTSPAFADLTADDVWAQWVASFSKSAGDGFDPGVQTRDGNTLTVSGLSVSFDEDDASGKITLGDVAFRDRGDGTVSIDLPQVLPITLDLTVEGDALTIPLVFSSKASSIIVSGDPADMQTQYAAGEWALSLGDISDLPQDLDLVAAMRFTGVSGQTKTTDADVLEMIGDFSAATLSYNLDVSDADEGRLSLAFTGNEVSASSTNIYPDVANLGNAVDLFAHPLYRAAANFAFGSSELTFDMLENQSSTSGVVSVGAGRLNVSVEDGALAYGGGSRDLAVSIESSDLPVPLNISLGEYGYRFGVPVAQSDEDKPIALGVRLQDFVLDDFLWNLFDPGAVLPRDPATIAFDLDALGKWNIDLTDPEAFERADVIPGDIKEATLSNLRVSAAGAELTGEGRFTFDFDDLFTFGGAPRPEGKLDLSLVGGNGLIDKLIQMGLVPQEQAMGARMMMGLFMTPGAGPDTLNSTLEINAQGHVLANGQRIR